MYWEVKDNLTLFDIILYHWYILFFLVCMLILFLPVNQTIWNNNKVCKNLLCILCKLLHAKAKLRQVKDNNTIIVSLLVVSTKQYETATITAANIGGCILP
jgi:hypothetical protein